MFTFYLNCYLTEDNYSRSLSGEDPPTRCSEIDKIGISHIWPKYGRFSFNLETRRKTNKAS